MNILQILAEISVVICLPIIIWQLSHLWKLKHIHTALNIPFDVSTAVPSNEAYTHIKCNHCKSHVAKYDHRGVCANCVAEGK